MLAIMGVIRKYRLCTVSFLFHIISAYDPPEDWKQRSPSPIWVSLGPRKIFKFCIAACEF